MSFDLHEKYYIIIIIYFIFILKIIFIGIFL